MDNINYLQLLFYLLPAIVVGFLAFYFISSYFKEQEQKRMYSIRAKNRKHTLPLRFQALERLTLFLERIDPGSLLLRVKPYNDNKNDYENLLVQNIEKEYEHNIAQQIYVSNECWNAIRATKNATIALIRKASMHQHVSTSDKLREEIISELMDKASPSQTGLAFVRREASDIW
ncbi:hypothetical protein [Mesonia sp. K7]|uniref:DUF7935 family protein n=1 Tax=Mesonia sp. K7 TaxID=2218606 RepID=UPI000DA9E970|nr:hypothetical protein [Mesonia sp. K7]PZD79441.1 hypothetical protein DNG35_00045 [Mesonia sp. K7]